MRKPLSELPTPERIRHAGPDGIAEVPTERWYAVHTGSRAEPRATAELRRRGFRVLFLHHHATVRHGRRERERIRPLFPRYLFVLAEPDRIHAINSAHGVASVVYQGGEPLVARGEFFDKWLENSGDDGCLGHIGPRKRVRHKAGDRVRIVNERNLLYGLEGTVVVDKGRMTRVLLRVFGSERVAFLAPGDLEACHPECDALPEDEFAEAAREAAFA